MDRGNGRGLIDFFSGKPAGTALLRMQPGQAGTGIKIILTKEYAVRGNKILKYGRFTEGIFQRIYPLSFYEDDMAAEQNVPNRLSCENPLLSCNGTAKLQIDDKYNLCYIRYIHNVSKGEIKYGKE